MIQFLNVFSVVVSLNQVLMSFITDRWLLTRSVDCIHNKSNFYTVLKVRKYGVFSGPYFLAFLYLSFSIQSECRKVRTRKNCVFGHFSSSVSNESKLLALKVYGHDCFENHFKASIIFRIEIPFQSNIVENWPSFTLRASSFEVGLVHISNYTDQLIIIILITNGPLMVLWTIMLV